jgi:hypothetical protein
MLSTRAIKLPMKLAYRVGGVAVEGDDVERAHQLSACN